MKRVKLLILFSLLYLQLIFPANCAEPLLEKKVSISLQNETLASALIKLSEAAKFDYSYNTQNLPEGKKITINIKDQPLKEVLDKIIEDPSVQYKVQNNQIIFYRSSESRELKTEQVLAGSVKDVETGEPVAGAIIYDKWLGISATTDRAGGYSLTISNPSYMLNLVCQHAEYQEKAIKTKMNADKTLHILLQKTYKPSEVPEKIEPISSTELLASVNQSDLTKFFVPDKVAEQASENTQLETKFFQIGILPLASTDGRSGGRNIHNASLSLIAGYSAGLEGVEIGGFANINKFNVNGVQVGGFANLTGGKTVGLQVAGFSNVTRLKTEGVQIAGFNNFSGLSMKGWQISGFQNLIKGDLYGVQLSGFKNLTTQGGKGAQVAGFLNTTSQSFQGFQVSGFANYTKGDLQHFQVAGFVNYLRGNTEGFQIAGFVNTAKDVGGFQLAGFVNYSGGDLEMFQVSGFANYLEGNSNGYQVAGFVNISDSVKGWQVAGFSNIAEGNVEGVQLAGFLNFAKKVKGHQIAFINIADTVESGLPIGLLNFIKKGYNRFEISAIETGFVNFQFKPGVKKLYTILTAGILPDPQYLSWQFGYGLGTSFKTGKKTDINIDVVSMSINENRKWTAGRNQVYRIAPSMSYQLGDNVDMFFGPSLNWQVYEKRAGENSDASKIPFHPLVSKEVSNNYDHNLWVGFQAGIGF